MEPFQERVLTPTGQRKRQVATPTAQSVDEKWKLSNKGRLVVRTPQCVCCDNEAVVNYVSLTASIGLTFC